MAIINHHPNGYRGSAAVIVTDAGSHCIVKFASGREYTTRETITEVIDDLSCEYVLTDTFSHECPEWADIMGYVFRRSN